MHLGIESFSDPMLLAKRKYHRAIMASSYDRRGGNHDWSNYIRREGAAAVMMEAEGPGTITRIWTADPQKGTVRIYLDRNPVPVIECPFAKLFDLLPLSQGIGGESAENYSISKEESVPMGHTSYCPIPFQQHVKITIDPEDDYLYYHVNANLYPPSVELKSFAPTEDSQNWKVAQAVDAVKRWSVGTPLVDMNSCSSEVLDLVPGETQEFLTASGPGAVRGIRISLTGHSAEIELDHLKNNLFLLGWFDDDEPRDPSLRSPIGPMFLDYGQEPRPRSLLLGSDSDGYYCFFPMPHCENAVLAIHNRSILTARILVSVLHDSVDEPDRDWMRFRASWHSETPFGPDHRDYEGLACRLLNLDGFNNVEFLNAFGAGHFVGVGFNIDLRDSPTDRAAGEGDEMFFIDDDPRLTHYGTGAEDYVNDAWGIRGYAGPFSGDAISGEWGVDPQIFGYRLHVPDPIPFQRHGRFTIEHGTGNNCSGTYRSVAYWYMDPSLTRTRMEEIVWEEIRTGKRKPNERD